mmetsp:Transcript_19018/g.34577  ORF Transcript_19018/g.34577 Transcript_19018/m.34577 type:complete len:106 (+) Transcript_19018:2012-2329(+)
MDAAFDVSLQSLKLVFAKAPLDIPSEQDDDNLHIIPSLSITLAKSLDALPRRKYKTKAGYTSESFRANSVPMMLEYDRKRLIEVNELKQGKLNLMRVDAKSTFML